MAREVLLVGSVPLEPASKVFEVVASHLGDLVPRIPDGEQIGWSSAARRAFERNDSLEMSRRVPLNALGADPVPIFKLKPGRSSKDLRMGPYGYAENARASYAEFVRLRGEGTIPSTTKYQVTLPGPGTSAFNIELSADELLPLARQALLEEIQNTISEIPVQDMAIQLDIAMEAEHEEYLRRPQAWDQPLHKCFDWTLAQMADSVAWLANRIPPQIELGFHICSIWHHDPGAGQDNEVLVDTANAIMSRINRPVGYLHIPVIPEHTAEDYLCFRRLELPDKAKLYLGLLNLADGIEGAKRRIAMATAAVPDFGISMFCGLGRPSTALARGPSSHSKPLVPELRRATSETIGEVLDLHRHAAML
jgi:hypothetical protein